MEGPIIALIAGATVSVSIYFAYLSRRSKDQADMAIKGFSKDAPSREEFEALNHQVAELAERVDFAEWLLAQQREAPRLNDPER